MSLERLTDLHRRADRFEAQRILLQTTVAQDLLTLGLARDDLVEIKGAIQLLHYVAEQTNKANEEQTAVLVTLALQETFEDQDLSLVVEHENKRGQPAVTFKLKDNTAGRNIEGDLMDSFGGGPASLIGLLLQLISVVRQKNMSRVLILDEPVAQISEEYQEACGKLLRKLCEPPPRGLSFKMLVITHMPTIANAAHKKYRATKSDDGKSVSLVEETTNL